MKKAKKPKTRPAEKTSAIKYGEQGSYQVHSWVEIRGKPAPGRIKAVTMLKIFKATIPEFEVESLDGKTYTGIRVSELRPWVRPVPLPKIHHPRPAAPKGKRGRSKMK